MRYDRTATATFLDRPNRFVAHVLLDGQVETTHVKNTGRCKELLVPGCTVVLAHGNNPKRKTAWDLVASYKVTPDHPDGWLFNIDSQAPNKIVGEWLAGQGFDRVKPEFTYGASRVDFMMEHGDRRFLMEVKGCTLEIDGIGYFPDAPTERGIKHLRELAAAIDEGWECLLAFAIPMEGVTEVRPNMVTHPAFGNALEEAKAAGVRVIFLPCLVKADQLRVDESLAPKLL